MDAKTEHKRKKQSCPSSDIPVNVPLSVRIAAMLDAQHVARMTTMSTKRGSARVELFWATYNFEFRQYIERWIKGSA